MIEEEFRRLEALDPADAARVEHRVEVGAPLGVVVGLSFLAKTRLLIIEGRRAVLAPTEDLEPTRGLEFRLVSRAGAGDRDAALEIEATDSRYNEVFAVLAGDIAAFIRGARDENHAAAALLSRLAHWRRFLERARPEGLSSEAQRGLYGELTFLRDQLAGVIGIASAIAAWRGPSHEVQDFVLGRVGIEVKTTIGRGNQSLTITSEHQLDERGLDQLYLYYLSMDAREGVGETLVAAIEDIRARAAGDPDALVRLNDLLVESGYLDHHRSLYEHLGFTFREERMYLVREGFPRIREHDLPDGVARVRYEVAVDACEKFRVPVPDTMKVIASEGVT
jgi:hypothetical protein